MNRAIAYLLAANSEAVILFLGAWWVGQWLNENYPKTFSWYMVTFLVAALVIFHSWYLMVRALLQKPPEQNLNKKES